MLILTQREFAHFLSLFNGHLHLKDPKRDQTDDSETVQANSHAFHTRGDVITLSVPNDL